MNKKRGMFFVVLFLLIVIFSFHSVHAVDEPKYQNLFAHGDDDGGNDNADYDASFENDLGSFKGVGCNEGSGWPTTFTIGGCYFFGVEDDSCGDVIDDSDSYGYGVFTSGTLTSYDRKIYDANSYSDLQDSDDYRNIIHSNQIRVVGGQGVCGYDSYWHVCTDDVAKKGKTEKKYAKTWGGGKLFQCSIKDNIAQWQDLGSDQDHDGITKEQGDCTDEPSKDSSFCTDIESPTDCSNQKYSSCAICINPAAKEVAGDGVDNNCDDKDALTPNDDKDACENPDQNQQHLSFAWMQDKDNKNNCCGDDPNDIGTVITAKGGFSQYICVDKEHVKYDPAIKNPPFDKSNNDKKSDYTWLSASNANAQFAILTINTDQEPYDIVSNGETWQKCQDKTTNLQPASPGGNGIYEDLLKTANRFQCYREGNHWSWAECANELSSRKNIGLKGRFQGEALYTLPLFKDDKGGTDSSRVGKVIDIPSSYYKDTYNTKEYSLDFTNYNYLNFMVKFGKQKDDKTFEPLSWEKLNLPLGLTVRVDGPIQSDQKPLTYFNEDVLGYATNSFFDPTTFMHIKVPLPKDLKGIKSIVISAQPSTNDIEVRNIYLSKDDSEPLCSGKDTTKEGSSSWLKEGADSNDPSTEVNGEQLCTQLYGDHAWLGNNLEVTQSSASCCGNSEHEYYAGKSKPLGDKKEYYGCWNSQPIKSNQSVMDVEMEVGYTENNTLVSYPLVDFNWFLDVKQDSSISYCSKDKENTPGYPSKCDFPFNPVTNIQSYSLSIIPGYYNDIHAISGLSWSNYNEFKSDQTYAYFTFAREGKKVGNTPPLFFAAECDTHLTNCPHPESLINQFIDKVNLSLLSEEQYSPHQPHKINMNLYGFVLNSKKEKTKFEENNLIFGEKRILFSFARFGNYADLFAITSDNPDIRIDIIDDSLLSNISVVASTQKINISLTNTPKNQNLLYPCSSSTCLYPLPGLPPYTITNPHPDLYELYFIEKDDKGNLKETLIDSTHNNFKTTGNIKAKKVAQQVLFTSDGLTAGFYGCNAAEYLIANNKITATNNKPSCSTLGQKFCAPSAQRGETKDAFTVISSWDDTPLTEIGYQHVIPTNGKTTDGNSFDLSTYQPLLQNIKDTPIPPMQRNHTSQVLPTRNFIPNAEFQMQFDTIPHWEIRKSDGTNLKDEYLRSKDKTLTLEKDETLISERISLPKNTNIQFTYKGKCITKISLAGKEPLPLSSSPFDTADASYITLQFIGPCTLNQPLLQSIDELGAVQEYNYQNPEKISRAGLSCCPDNSCWNGYACVQSMDTSSFYAEHISAGRDYRCINGEWTKSSLKWDWNGEQWGFCSKNNQCFVSPSSSSEDNTKRLSYTASDFTKGNTPLCINDKESILDHYCDNGQWTSRTKSVAAKLLEIAQSDEYILSCSPPQNALLEFDNKENYIFGIQPPPLASQPLGLGQKTTTTTTPTQNVCFKLNDPTGKLVPPKDNTCINNICILKYKENGKFTTAFGTTLNKPLDDKESFLNALNIPPDKLKVCQSNNQDTFVKCNLDNLGIPGDLWYDPNLNALIYSKTPLTASGNIIDQITSWFKNLFDKKTTSSEQFPLLTQAKNMKEIYLSTIAGHKVSAIKEVQGNNQTLIAEYENFDTSICEYINHLTPTDSSLKIELLEKATGKKYISCTQNDNIQRVEANKGLDFFWPMLTNNLRINTTES